MTDTPILKFAAAAASDVRLATLFEQLFLPIKLQNASVDYVSQHRTALRWLADALGREPTIDDLRPESLASFEEALRSAGIRQSRRDALKQRLFGLWRFAHHVGLSGPFTRGRKAARLELAAAEGSVWHYFESVYRPQKLIGCERCTLDTYRTAFRFLRRHYGRDILIDEQTDQLAADHLEWLLARGITARRVNAHRGCWFTVWRFAKERGAIGQLPTVRKLRCEEDEPDAWTEDEAARIVEACASLRTWPDIAGIRADRYFRALLLVGWWTALRRGTLLKLRRADVDFDSAWLTVTGSKMKNRRGKRFRLGADALEAVRQIWFPERELIFPWPFNDRCRMFYRYFDHVVSVAGIAPSTRNMGKLHKWRRTVATVVAVKAGLMAASALLGHSAADVTRRYIDPSKMPGADATQILPSITSYAGGKER